MRLIDYDQYFMLGVLLHNLKFRVSSRLYKNTSFKEILNNLNDLYLPHFDYAVLSFRFHGKTIRELSLLPDGEGFFWQWKTSSEDSSIILEQGGCQKGKLQMIVLGKYKDYLKKVGKDD